MIKEIDESALKQELKETKKKIKKNLIIKDYLIVLINHTILLYIQKISKLC